MKAQRLHTQKPIQEKPLTLEDILLPEPIPNQIRIKVKYCGVCHTDLHTVEGDIHPPSFPITPGHQVVGIVEKRDYFKELQQI